jgi:YjbR
VSPSNEAIHQAWVVTVCMAQGLVEGSHHGRVDFRSEGKIVVNLETDGSITIKLPNDEQQALLSDHPDAVSLPAGWGHHGWTTLRVDQLDKDLVEQLIAQSIETVNAPKSRKR